MLELRGLSKRWGAAFAHKSLDLSIERGEFFVLLGPSGSGKSLLLELIAGFHRPDAGRILLGGRDVTDLPPEKRGMGFVYQDQMLFPHKTVRRNIAYGPTVRKVPRDATARKVAELAELLRLEPLLDRPATQLSVGQKQRVALARALAVEPELLLLDEPFSSLDPPLQQRLRGELRTLHKHTGVTVLHVTHDRDEARLLGDRIGVIQDGRLEQVGADHSVFQKPNSRFVAEFTGGGNIYAGSARSLGDLTEFRRRGLILISSAKATGPCKALVRPENIIISRTTIRTSARNLLEGRVESVVREGDLCRVAARLVPTESGANDPDAEERMTCIVTPRSVEDLEIAPGVCVFFSFKVGSVHLFDVGEDQSDEAEEAM